MKKKIKLTSLEIQSFITEVNPKLEYQLKGGSLPTPLGCTSPGSDIAATCFNTVGGGICPPSVIPPCSMVQICIPTKQQYCGSNLEGTCFNSIGGDPCQTIKPQPGC